jgi:hypothetical protein
MISSTRSAERGVFQSAAQSVNKPFSFSKLASCFRAELEQKPACHPLAVGCPASPVPREPGVRPGSSSGSGQTVAAGAPLESVDPLELNLAFPLGASGLAEGDRPMTAAEVVRGARVLPEIETRIVEEVVRRVAWGGDRRRGVARIELDGEYRGTTVWLESDGRTVELSVELAPGLDARALPERLLGRLRGRGLDVVEVQAR